MGTFLKKLLEPSEQDTLRHLMQAETPSTNTSRRPCTGKGGWAGVPCARVMGSGRLEGARCVLLQRGHFPQAGVQQKLCDFLFISLNIHWVET